MTELSERLDYLRQALGELLQITLYADFMNFRSTVDRIGPDLFCITLDPPYRVLVDTKRYVVDDPGGLLSGFPGRLSRPRDYRVSWRDAEGLPLSTNVAASSRRFARLFAEAPPNAYVERV